jgi:hypothetical protein
MSVVQVTVAVVFAGVELIEEITGALEAVVKVSSVEVEV